MNICDLRLDESARIVNLAGEHNQRLKLLDSGLVPGTTVTVHKIAPLGDPIQVRVRGYELTLRKEEALLILVEPLDATPATPVAPASASDSAAPVANQTPAGEAS